MDIRKKVKYINYLALVSIGIFCLLYSIFYSNFAELHINFKFLPFPVFVGEILLAFCLVLLVIKWSILKIKFNFYHFILFIFIGFILFKAIFGYFKWGALAFRNSALFYYPLFALIGYYFYNRDIFNLIWIKIFLILILSISAFLKIPQDYYLFTYCLLIAVLSYKLPYKYLRWIGILMAIIIFLKSDLFNQTKGMLVSILIAILYLVFCLWFWVKKINFLRYLYFLIGVGTIVVILIFSLNPSTIKRISVWAKWDNLVSEIRYYNQYANKEIDYKPKEFVVVKLFEENKGIITSKPETKNSKLRSGDEDLYNILWRIFVWKDMLREIIKEKAIFGLDFGKPFRSLTLEKLRNTEGTGWYIGDCVGWLEPHNSYIHILYRAGMVGLFFIIAIWVMFIKIVFRFIRKMNFIGILLTCALLYWLILGNFIVLLELPYFAIPFWSLYGMSIACIFKNKNICVE